ncbi:thermonuclease family protein [Sulfuritortus calidifontis]|uniref:thermonuclease family protein n=1 Tax=Sulfuritortus calidifontis TaxID=1914471 RepID=UPI001E47B52D|nr:thermonuclease family protein [Sulfuritortus calidifontis]
MPLSPHAAHAALSGYVVAITDGDTIQLLDDQHRQHKIRIAGIDAPEKAQAFGSKSQTNLGRLAFQKQAVADCPKRDRYDRLICKVVVDGRDIGLQQIADGMAWWYRRYSSEQSSEDRQLYEQAEVMARMRRIGLWMDSIPQPPWEWRKSN